MGELHYTINEANSFVLILKIGTMSLKSLKEKIYNWLKHDLCIWFHNEVVF